MLETKTEKSTITNIKTYDSSPLQKQPKEVSSIFSDFVMFFFNDILCDVL